MNSGFLARMDHTLAAERLDAYRRDAASPEVGFARYLLNLALCESLYSPLHLAEVALRNTIHRSLTVRYGSESWFDSSLVPLGEWQRKTIATARERLLAMGKPITPGRMIAELTFGFWAGFFNKQNARTGLGFYLVKHAFPYAPREERDLAGLDRRWERVRDLRNRVFHHERIIHFADLDDQHACILDLIEWICPELRELAATLDRFATLRREGLQPWLAKLAQHWPHTP